MTVVSDPLADRLRDIANDCEATPAYNALHDVADELDAAPLHYERVTIWETSQDGEYTGWVAKFQDGTPCDQLWGTR